MQKVNLYSSSLNDLLCNGIVRKYQFKSPGRYHYDKLDAYLVDSEIYRSITYGIDHRDFFILDKRGFIVCPIKDIDCLLKTLVKPIQREIKDILQDTEDLRRMDIDYETPMPGLYATLRRMPRNLRTLQGL